MLEYLPQGPRRPLRLFRNVGEGQLADRRTHVHVGAAPIQQTRELFTQGVVTIRHRFEGFTDPCLLTLYGWSPILFRSSTRRGSERQGS